ncbi:SGNH/GDSL hydrolase family protein [Nitrosomonas eutropha]|uniref:SGNH/GDSL hydrolase family protein n=1 Tax=Nitrosomonas eutropha TaxID=916 RepID=UPI0008D7E288|nr:SGNH/GDSL hydrolase family protein [Nitrosomonas eutropha]SEI75902.1 Phospholipase/lecithinase/hemolysin [Nitrosomonas eutropha]
MKKLIMGVLFLAFMLSGAVWATPFTSLYAFGDSLSDGGNSPTAVTSIYKLLGNNCDPTHPCPPYVGGHYSNGPVAVEYLANSILPGGANSGNFFNFSVAGATSGIGNYGDGGSATSSGIFGLPGISLEIGGYLFASGGVADPDALYFVWGGANDFLTLDSPTAAAQNIAANVDKLMAAGATHFFVPNLPDLGLTPLAAEGNVQGLATLFSTTFNTVLSSELAALGTQFPVAEILQFDTYSFFNRIVGDPAAYGFTNAQASCLAFQAGGVRCSNPDQYVYWDDLHPTTQAHALFGSVFARAIPAPGTLFLLMLGWLALVFARGNWTCKNLARPVNSMKLVG